MRQIQVERMFHTPEWSISLIIFHSLQKDLNWISKNRLCEADMVESGNNGLVLWDGQA